MKPITIKAASSTPVLKAARELVLACEAYRRGPHYGREAMAISFALMGHAEEELATLLGLERDAKTGRYVR